jgi:hypothetical protein
MMDEDSNLKDKLIKAYASSNGYALVLYYSILVNLGLLIAIIKYH